MTINPWAHGQIVLSTMGHAAHLQAHSTLYDANDIFLDNRRHHHKLIWPKNAHSH